MNAAKTETSGPQTAPDQAIRRLAAAIAAHAERSAETRSFSSTFVSSAKPALEHPAKTAERFASLPMT